MLRALVHQSTVPTQPADPALTAYKTARPHNLLSDVASTLRYLPKRLLVGVDRDFHRERCDELRSVRWPWRLLFRVMQSAFAKLSRARKHLTEFESSMRTYRDSGAIRFDVRSRRDPLDSRQVIIETIARVAPEPPAEDWGLMVGDVLTNLRGALDHALFGHIIARFPGLSDGQQKSIQLPVVDDSAKWPGYVSKYIDPVNPWVAQPVWDEIEANQPMHADNPREHQLHLLHKLVGLDKHRAIHVVAHRAAASLDDTYQQLTELPNGGQPLVDGAVLARDRRLRPLRFQGPRWEKGRGGTAYLEYLDIPGYSHVQWGALATVQGLVDATGRFLHTLKTVGC